MTEGRDNYHASHGPKGLACGVSRRSRIVRMSSPVGNPILVCRAFTAPNTPNIYYYDAVPVSGDTNLIATHAGTPQRLIAWYWQKLHSGTWVRRHVFGWDQELLLTIACHNGGQVFSFDPEELESATTRNPAHGRLLLAA